MNWTARSARIAVFVVALAAAGVLPAACSAQDSEDRTQKRTHSEKVTIDPARIRVDDGDTVTIEWAQGDVERIRILGIDTPETRHVEHNLPYPQPWGHEARGFAMGAFASATKVELLRASMMDPYGRTLGYLFINDVNYSVMVVMARLAVETVSHYGDNGLPKESEEVLAAAKLAGPVAFEPPHVFRRRMRDVAEWMKKEGRYPTN